MRTETAAIAYHFDGSWARLAAGTVTVTQGGPRNLWDDIESTHRTWIQAGKPARQRYQLTITGQHQQVLLDNPRPPSTSCTRRSGSRRTRHRAAPWRAGTATQAALRYVSSSSSGASGASGSCRSRIAPGAREGSRKL